MRGCLLGLRECESPVMVLMLRNSANELCSMIIVAVFCLAVAHPGPVFARQESEKVGHISGEPKTGLEHETGVGQAV